jgi:hypothetical protein
MISKTVDGDGLCLIAHRSSRLMFSMVQISSRKAKIRISRPTFFRPPLPQIKEGATRLSQINERTLRSTPALYSYISYEEENLSFLEKDSLRSLKSTKTSQLRARAQNPRSFVSSGKATMKMTPSDPDGHHRSGSFHFNDQFMI